MNLMEVLQTLDHIETFQKSEHGPSQITAQRGGANESLGRSEEMTLVQDPRRPAPLLLLPLEVVSLFTYSFYLVGLLCG